MLTALDQKCGPRVWRLNNLMLADDNYKAVTRQTITNSINDCEILDPFEGWEYVKSEAIEQSKFLSKAKAKAKRLHQTNLEKTLEILEKDIQQFNDQQVRL